MIDRRRFLQATGATLIACRSGIMQARAADGWSEDLSRRLREIESQSGGRLGVAIVDTATDRQAGHRADELFPMCSTFKLLASAAVLSRVDKGQERLERRIRFEPRELLAYSPVTKEHAGGNGMPLGDLCKAAMTFSDNTAANLILASLGGPTAVTAYARSLGDVTTRLDRIEPDLNEAIPADARDTTKPAATVSDLRTLLLGSALTPRSRDQLIAWLIANKTGDARLRAGLPPGWRVGDKTGSGDRGTANDIGILWPPERPPILVAAYLTGTQAGADQRNATLAAVGRAIAIE